MADGLSQLAQPQVIPPYLAGRMQSYGMILPTSMSIGESTSGNQATSNAVSNSYIPQYSETPILDEAAQYARSMAPQIYQWGMDQFNKNQGNIDTMMRNALTYASPARIQAEMGMAQARTMQAAEAGRQSAISDLQSYGIDPSSGRYASLDQANRVMAGAQAAGAGNVARESAIQSGLQQQQTAEGLSLQNVGTGYGAASAANQFLGNTMSLKFPPLGTTSQSGSQSSGSSQSANVSQSQQYYPPGGGGGGGTQGTLGASGQPEWSGFNWQWRGTTPGVQEGGGIPSSWSPSGGARTDDVPANLNAGEFVIPKDVSEWKGQEFFYKLMAQARAARAKSDTPPQQMGVGYAGGGDVKSNKPNRSNVENDPYVQRDPTISYSPYYSTSGLGDPLSMGMGSDAPPPPPTRQEEAPSGMYRSALTGHWVRGGYQGGGAVGGIVAPYGGAGAFDRSGNPIYDVLGKQSITHAPAGAFATPSSIVRGPDDPFAVGYEG